VCNCGGSSNVYKPADQTRAAQTATATPRSGLPAVWNGPRPRATAKP